MVYRCLELSLPSVHTTARPVTMSDRLSCVAHAQPSTLLYRPSLCIAPNLFRINKFPSMNRSTQFCVQLCSFLSRLPPEILPVMHFFQQTSVIVWTASIESAMLDAKRAMVRITLLECRLLHLVVHELLELLLVFLRESREIDLRCHGGGVHGGGYISPPDSEQKSRKDDTR